MNLLGILQAAGPEAATLAQSAIVQVGAAVGVATPGLAVAWKLLRSMRLNGHGRNGNGYGRLEERIRSLDRLVDRNHDELCDRITETNERMEKVAAELWAAVNRIRGVV